MRRRAVGAILGLLALGVLALGVLALTGCRAADGGGRIIAVIPKGTENPYWQSVHAGAAAAARKYGYQIWWNGPPQETDYTQQVDIVDDAISRGVQGIVLAPAQQQALVPAVRRADQARIPVAIMDSGIALPPSAYVSYVASNNRAGGQMDADYLARLLHGHGDIAVVGVAPGSVSTVQREDGFRTAMARSYPGIHIVAFQYGMADVAKSRAVADDILSAHPHLDGMFASNESSALGCVLALRAHHLAGKVPLVGFDTDPDLVRALRDGTLSALMVQDPYQIGYDGVQELARKLAGQPTPARIQTPLHLVTASNMQQPGMRAVLFPPVYR
ncbi:MAG: substrate-binding domain-containing protein [Terriglobales bacterium]